jgi:hypothetical protein
MRVFTWRAEFGNMEKWYCRYPPDINASTDCADRTHVSDLIGNQIAPLQGLSPAISRHARLFAFRRRSPPHLGRSASF